MTDILIIDDSPTQAASQKRILQSYGFNVTSESDATSGILAARSSMPDLILMDIVMPGMNGFQATRKLSKDPYTKSIPVILVSTKNQKIDRVWGARQGAKAYIAKPVDPTELINAINECLNQTTI
ncbi:response regulator [Marinicellulosiphila megalodicopiae]|uniref:response regulator n=1 Tax=Marinicellulosiphila megalodicopiae TaxID=2724896 RepID=UPI003BB0546B